MYRDTVTFISMIVPRSCLCLFDIKLRSDCLTIDSSRGCMVVGINNLYNKPVCPIYYTERTTSELNQLQLPGVSPLNLCKLNQMPEYATLSDPISAAYPIANKTILSTNIESTAFFNEVYELEHGYLHVVAWHV